ncbi:MAG: hypothetical protein ACPGO3_14160 [Magnetospiraceae bacterium]
MFAVPQSSLADPSAVAPHAAPVRGLSMSADGRHFISGGFDNTVRYWDFDTLAPRQIYDGHDGPVTAVDLLPDGRRALSAADDGTAILWDLASGTVLTRFTGHRGKVADIAVSSDGKMFVTAGWDGTVRLWSLTGPKDSRLLDLPIDYHAVAFEPGAPRLWCADRSGRLTRIDTETGAILQKIDGKGFAVLDIAMGTDGQTLVTAGADGTVRVWHRQDGTEILRFEGHEGPVLHVRVLHKTGAVVSAGQDGRVILWTLEDIAAQTRFITHRGPIWAFAITPDDRFALTGHTDGTVQLWHLETGDAVTATKAVDVSQEAWWDSKEPGAKLYRACASCHSLTKEAPQRAGPHLEGLFGRKAGSVSGYRYSPTLARTQVIWTEETLKALFRQGPNIFMPGTKMPLQRIENETSLNNLMQFLKIHTAGGIARR